MSFLTKVAFFGFGEKKPEQKLTSEHTRHLLPHFKKAEIARKKMIAGKISEGDYFNASEPFLNGVAEVEHKSGISNEKIYKHMYDNYS